jgi:cysteinyl-tRNA synthetase
MELRLYDTLTREKRPFKPLDPNRVRMYVCGPTVYDFAHIGNARPFILFDVLYRLLRHLYGAEHVTYVRNITDVDDKINARAAEEFPNLPLNQAIRLVTEKTEQQFHEDMDALGCLRPTVEPRATEHIAEMRTLIERLVAAGHAYVAEEHVLFSVPSMPDYGKLARRSLEEMKVGARVEVAPYKRDPMDFVLWKPSKPGEPAWPSPAGIATPGRPGWHIECSAMSWKHLGETFDIHGGGIDLVFPHHENEIAQSRCAFHTPVMANYWMHNGFLQVEGEKMSKSLGNFFTIRDLLNTDNFGGKKWPGEVLRLAMLMTHYRQPIDWTVKCLEEAQSIWEGWKQIVANVDVRNAMVEPSESVKRALFDDLNTPDAVRRMHEIAQDGQRNRESRDILYSNVVFLGLLPDQLDLAKRGVERIERVIQALPTVASATVSERLSVVQDELQRFFVTLPSSANSAATVSTTTTLLGKISVQPSFLENWTRYNQGYLSSLDRQFIEETIGIDALNRLIERRIVAREAKQFAESDRIRDELKARGIELEDRRGAPPNWRVKR